MRKFCQAVVVLLLFAVSASSRAQERVEVGLSLDYLSISQTSTDNIGVGARFEYLVHRDVMLEGELIYDYGIDFDELYRNVTNANLVGDPTDIDRCHRGSGGSNVPAIHGALPPFRHPEGLSRFSA